MHGTYNVKFVSENVNVFFQHSVVSILPDNLKKRVPAIVDAISACMLERRRSHKY
jgi:hypothetical protein